jgi:hypothetical protein
MEIIVETFVAHGEASGTLIRARPLSGQGLETHLRVECSKSMRMNHPVGTLFKVWVQWKSKLGGPRFLYASYHAPYEVVDQVEASHFVRRNALRATSMPR